MPVTIEAALGRGAALRIFGDDYPTPDGTAVRDYVHVVDLAEAHEKALLYLAAGGPSATVNLGTGRASSVREVRTAVERATGRPVPHQVVGRRPGDPARVWADNTRASQLLGWRPDLGMDDIVQSAVHWHRNGSLGPMTPRP